jgi:hypothetical protein
MIERNAGTNFAFQLLSPASMFSLNFVLQENALLGVLAKQKKLIWISAKKLFVTNDTVMLVSIRMIHYVPKISA